MLSFKEYWLLESSPPGTKAEDWVKANKEKFKKEYGEDKYEEVLYATAWKLFGKKEDAMPVNTTDGVANSDSQPLYKHYKVAETDYVEVDDETYNKCKFGKQKYERWNGYVADENLQRFIKTKFGNSKRMMVVNSNTGAHAFLKR